MKKLLCLIVAIAILGLIVSGCSIPLKSVVPTSEKGNQKPELGTPEIERGVFVDYGYNSPPWYPEECSECETDTYRWPPKYYWASTFIDVFVNATTSGFAEDDAVAEVAKGFAAWNNVGTDYSATVSRGDTVGPSLDYPDEVNTVSWGTIDGSDGIIAVTYYWYYANTKELIDVDIVFDVAEPWSISYEVPSNAFDVWNIAAHEAGHTLVLQDIRSPKDCGLTMHAYTWCGDALKRDLAPGDILGVEAIYGE
jgi:hypothetical protein